jgi:hypothetical protein
MNRLQFVTSLENAALGSQQRSRAGFNAVRARGPAWATGAEVYGQARLSGRSGIKRRAGQPGAAAKRRGIEPGRARGPALSLRVRLAPRVTARRAAGGQA